MKIGIIGRGYVGGAIAGAHHATDLLINDPKLSNSVSIDEIKSSTAWTYVCVPTPMSQDGRIDTSIVDSVFDSLEGYTGLVIAKSTALPSFYVNAKKSRNFRLVHVPEFLTAANALRDYMKPKLIVIGGGVDDCVFYKQQVIEQDLTDTTMTKFIATDIGTASAMKYYANSFLATKVVFNNQFAAWCQQQGVDWNHVANISSVDDRLGSTHWSVPGPDGLYGYGGACFPKDVSAILKSAADSNVDMSLLQFQTELNLNLRRMKK